VRFVRLPRNKLLVLYWYDCISSSHGFRQCRWLLHISRPQVMTNAAASSCLDSTRSARYFPPAPCLCVDTHCFLTKHSIWREILRVTLQSNFNEVATRTRFCSASCHVSKLCMTVLSVVSPTCYRVVSLCKLQIPRVARSSA